MPLPDHPSDTLGPLLDIQQVTKRFTKQPNLGERVGALLGAGSTASTVGDAAARSGSALSARAVGDVDTGAASAACDPARRRA